MRDEINGIDICVFVRSNLNFIAKFRGKKKTF